MEYNFNEIERRWQKLWREQGVYHVQANTGIRFLVGAEERDALPL